MLITTATYQKIKHPHRPDLYLPVVTRMGIHRATRNTAMRTATKAKEYAEKVMSRYNRMVQYCNDKMITEQMNQAVPSAELHTDAALTQEEVTVFSKAIDKQEGGYLGKPVLVGVVEE